MNQTKENVRGITLIALIITIVILLILVAISIQMLIGENGIFNYAKQAKSDYANAEQKNASMLNQLEIEMNQYLSGHTSSDDNPAPDDPADIYGTPIGTWIDGKTLYQKILVIPNYQSRMTIDISYLNYDYIQISSRIKMPINVWRETFCFPGGNCFVDVIDQNGMLGFWDNPSAVSYNGGTVYVTIQYTQKDDSSQYTSSNVYSLDETVIGTWIDGKPLYRKVFVLNNYQNRQSINIANLNYDYVQVYSRVKLPNNIWRETFCFPGGNCFVDSVDANGNLAFWNNTGDTTYNGGTVYSIVEYTKKDDVPIQTENTTYSQEETAIGTWIDGKTLYRKVIVTPNYQDGQTTDLSDLHYDYIQISSRIKMTTNVWRETFCFPDGNCFVDYVDANQQLGFDFYKILPGYMGGEIYTTIEYTKSDE